MTFPGGQPGGYPGQGPQQPLQGPGGYGPPPGPGMKLGLPQIAHLIVAGLGVLILFLAFASVGDGLDASFYEYRIGWVPALLLVGGLLSLKVILPGEDKKPGLIPPVIVFSTVWAYLFTVFTADGDLGTGGIMVMIFGILQMLAAIAALLLDLGIIKPPAPNPYGQQPGMYPPSGAFPQQQQPGQPQPGQYGQQPPAPPPQPGQQTTFAPQQGQFGQQPTQQQPPGTPPGGYPQQ
ncbi:DUF5336 domain-containing protein [Actinophytocola gossypii]|uniref:DUF5336 domain-containing protein n=1 Tax=Actinophytocola gossypii TaxID=2812003 RepID=A0ABT2JEB7_9PSEU|nr:DUF5336 domain-containing protein [Actinophytocola gossypii]MCT2586061.1 DUF5336 domain-containing protein [Actinophytocola gossypii]